MDTLRAPAAIRRETPYQTDWQSRASTRFRMDDTTPPADPKKDFNTLDLSQLQAFSFGTQWAQDKQEHSDGGNRGPRDRDGQSRDDRPRREGPGGPDKRDRRAFKRPVGAPGGSSGPGSGGGGQLGGEQRPPRFEGGADRGPRPTGDDRRGRSEGGFAPRSRPALVDRTPYFSPFFDVTFYPEDTSFESLAKTIRASCRTFELFDIARTVIGKNDRFVAVIQHKRPVSKGGNEGGGAPRTKPCFYISLPDGALFDTEDGALAHVTRNHLGMFFDEAQVEVDPPKGNFQVINKCGVTGALLGPPNFHRYAQAVQQHHAAHAAHMPLEVYRNRVETVRDPEVVAAWLESMKRVTRFTWKTTQSEAKKARDAAEAIHAVASFDEVTPITVETAETVGEAPATEGMMNEAGQSVPEVTAADEATGGEPVGPSFDSVEDARVYLLTQARDRVVRAVDSGRFLGKMLDTLPDGEIKRAVLGALERQRKFPLDTANALRGRLRREGFTIFKKGSKGVSYVCAVKRKFRLPGQTFAESIGELIDFIESHPLVKGSELPEKFLGYTPAAGGDAPAVVDQVRLQRLQGDLRWLVTEGYVTEFLNGGLFASPAMVASKSDSPDDEPDGHEEFPEAPALAAVAGTSASGPVETPEPAAEIASEQPVAESELQPEAVAAPVKATPEAAVGSEEIAPDDKPVANTVAEETPPVETSTEAAPSEDAPERKPSE